MSVPNPMAPTGGGDPYSDEPPAKKHRMNDNTHIGSGLGVAPPPPVGPVTTGPPVASMAAQMATQAAMAAAAAGVVPPVAAPMGPGHAMDTAAMQAVLAASQQQAAMQHHVHLQQQQQHIHHAQQQAQQRAAHAAHQANIAQQHAAAQQRAQHAAHQAKLAQQAAHAQAQAARAHQAQTQARAAQQPPPQAQPPQSAGVVPPTVAPPPAAAAQATPAPPPKSAAPTPNPKTVPIPLADIPTTPGGYKISQVATRAPVMSKTREGIWKVKGKGRTWKTLTLKEKEQFFDENWSDEQKDKPGSWPWALSLKPVDKDDVSWMAMLKGNGADYFGRQERAEKFDHYFQGLKHPNPWYLPGAGGAENPDQGPRGTADLQGALGEAKAKRDAVPKNTRHRLGAPTSNGPAKPLTQAELNKNFERMLPNLINYMPYFENMTGTKVAVLMETKAEYGARVGRGKRSASNDATRYYATVGSTNHNDISLNATHTLSSRVKNFVDAWQDGAQMAQSELDNGHQDRNSMVLLPPPSKTTNEPHMAQAPPAQVVATGVPPAAVPPAPNSVPAPPPAVSAVQK